MKLLNPKIRQKFAESLKAVLPVVGIVIVLSFTIAPITSSILPLFVLLAKIIGSKIVIGILLAMLAVAVIYFGGAIIYNTVTRKKLIERYQNERGN